MPTRSYVTGPKLWLALGIVYVVWGSTYFGIAVAVESLPPFLMLAIRFLIAGGLLVGWELLRGGRAALPTLRQVRDSAVVGALLLGIGNGFVALGEAQGVASGIAAILVAMMPLWLAVFGWLYFRERLPRIALLGVVIGLVGVAVLIWPTDVNTFDLVGIGVLLVAPIGWTHGSLFSAHRADLPRQPLMASGVQMLAGAAVLAVEGVVTGELATFHPEAISLRSLLALIYLVSIGSMLAYNAFAWLLRNAPLSLIGTYAYVNPVVAVALGGLFLAEPITPRTLVASAVIVAAVAMIVTARGRAHRGSNDIEVDSPEEAVHQPGPSSSVGVATAKPVSLGLDPRRGSSG
ncbi:MAG TPA: EamA family transporter [Candidatus Limnocylindrales bacterium]|jgi:drug/metabolite transporter (DMT)-like permease